MKSYWLSMLLVFFMACAARGDTAVKTDSEQAEAQPEQKLIYKRLTFKSGPADYASPEVMKEIANNPKVKALYEEFGPIMYWVQPVNLSSASEICVRVRTTYEVINPYIIFFSLKPEGRSPKIYLKAYAKNTLTVHPNTVVHIPTFAFKAEGWTMEGVCMYIVDFDVDKDVDIKDIIKNTKDGLLKSNSPLVGFESEPNQKFLLNMDPNFVQTVPSNTARTIQAEEQALLPDVQSVPDALTYIPLDVTRSDMFQDGKLISRSSEAVFSYKHVYGAEGHAMVLWLDPIDLSKAVEVRMDIKVSVPSISPALVLRDSGEKISPLISLDQYAPLGFSADDFRTVTIPTEVFKTKGWNMEQVRLVFVGFNPRRENQSDCTVSVTNLCAGFLPGTVDAGVAGEAN